MINEQLIKTAVLGEFVDEALETVKDNFDFKNRPFETIFSTVGSAWLAGRIPVIGFLVYVAEAMGYGPGNIGILIDKALGYGKDKAPDISNVDAASETAATSVVDSMKNGIEEFGSNILAKFTDATGITAANQMLYNIKISKGFVTQNDIIVATLYAETIVKEAFAFPGWAKLKSLFTGGKSASRFSLIGALKGIIANFLKGILGVSIAGGAIGAVKSITDGTETSSKSPMPKALDIGGDFMRYKNYEGNVSKTIVMFLNNRFSFQGTSFTDKFKETYNVDVENSPQMRKLLTNISVANKGMEIQDMATWGSFIAPDIKAIGQLFFPDLEVGEVKVEENKETPVSKPKQKPNASQLDNLLERFA
jgi:hypothetical protein